jgi:hypothetical protein
MGTLRSVFDELRSEDLRFASDEDVERDVEELERASRVLDGERARRIAEVSTDGGRSSGTATRR